MSNSSSSVQQTSGSLGTANLLGVAFIVLKLTGVIAWSWLWVLAPFWIPWAIVLVILAIVLVVWILDQR